MSSTWPSVREVLVVALAQPHDLVDAEVVAAASTRSASRDTLGLRLSCSRHCSVVISVPSPSTKNDPPSSTIGAT